MSTIKIGTVAIDLVANTVSFSQGMTKAEQIALNSSKNIQRSLNLISTTAVTMAASLAASFSTAIVKSQEYAFSVQKAAMQVGTSTQMFSKLGYAAKMAGLPIENVRYGLERLARTSSAAQGGQKQTIAAYAALGISVKDLKGKLSDTGNLFVAVSKGLDKYRDSATKTGLEQKLLGRSGAEIAPLIKQIAIGFDRASQQATLFGVVIGDKTAAQAAKLHTSLEQIESISLGLSLRLLNGVSPALDDAASKILKFATSANGMQVIDKIATDVSKAIYAAGNAFDFLVHHAEALKVAFIGLASVRVSGMLIKLGLSAMTAEKGIADIGIAALTAIGRVTGFSQAAGVFMPIITGAYGTATALLELGASEGYLTTLSFALQTALNSLKATLMANPVTAALAGSLVVLGLAFRQTLNQAKDLSNGAAESMDVWTAAVNQLTDKYEMLHLLMDKVKGSALTAQDKHAQDIISKYGVMGKTMAQAVADAAKDRVAAQPKATQDIPQSLAKQKPDAPSIPLTEAKDKTDHLKLKLLELATAAKTAHESLLNAGKGVDFERASDITKEYSKIIAELDPELKKLSKSQRAVAEATIKSYVTTAINDSSQAKYKDELQKTNAELLAQVDAQDSLTAAIGKTNSIVRATAISDYSIKQDAGKSEEWKRQNVGMRKQRDVLFGQQYDAANKTADETALLGIQRQITAQQILNNAILAGKDAREEAAQVNAEQGIRDAGNARGSSTADIEKQIAASRELFNLKQAEGDLNRARSMNPAQVYLDEAKAINDAADAAKNAGKEIDAMQLKAANKRNWDEYLASVDRATLAVGSLSDGTSVFFKELARNSQSAASMMHDTLGEVFNSLNDSLARLAEGGKVNVREMFSGVIGQTTKQGLHQVESTVTSGIMKHLGQGDKTPAPEKMVTLQTTTNTYLGEMLAVLKSWSGAAGSVMSGGGSVTPGVSFGGGSGGSSSPFSAALGLVTGSSSAAANAGSNGMARTASALSTATSAVSSAGGFLDNMKAITAPSGKLITGGTTTGNTVTGASPASTFLSVFSKVAPMVSSFFGGHRALGGDVTAGMSYDVGEMGRETFVPTQNGKIIPNNKLGGGGTHYHIDARHSHDPAQTAMQIRMALQHAGPKIVSSSMKAMKDHNHRMPLAGH